MKSLKTATLNLMFSIVFMAVMALFITSLTGFSFLITFSGLLLAASLIKPGEGLLMETVVKPLSEQLADMRTSLENQLSTKAQAEVKAQLKEFEENIKALENKVDKTELKTLQDSLEELKKLTEETKNWSVKKDEADKKNQEAIDKMLADRRKGKIGGATEIKSFNEILGEAIKRNEDAIRNYRPMVSKSGEQTTSFGLFTDEEKKSLDATPEGEVKAIGDMTIANNFPGAPTMYQDVRGLVQNPYNKVYLADILPNGTSGGAQIAYPKESAGDNAVSTWTDYTANKQQVDFNITGKTVPFIWGAGYVIVQRDMLDDIPFMTSYLQSRLLISLKTWENGLITNGAPGVDGLQTVGTPYSGTLIKPVDRIIDAAYGQIVDDTAEFYNGTHVIVRSRDLITKIALNKSDGSQEYDLPAGAVVFNPDGTVKIGNLTVVGTTSIPVDTFYALDSRATLFVRRILPELRLFEDATLAKKNQVMWRIEERATFMVFNNSAVVKGVTQTS